VAADAKLDLLTIDGAGGGTGMSPWNMMDHWGVPSLHLHAKTYEYCKVLADRGVDVPDISLAGGFAREDHLFKAMALCAPFTKLVCMGRAPMIPGYLGSNIEGVFKPEKPREGQRQLGRTGPHVTSRSATRRRKSSPAGKRQGKVGADEMKNVPFGAIAMYGYADKLACGLQQFMAGARKFNLAEIVRDDLFAANQETADITGIPMVTEAQNEEALAILNK
jgi:glutamate synthase domain-containing protein 2